MTQRSKSHKSSIKSENTEIKKTVAMDYSKLTQLIIKDLTKTNSKNVFYKKYSKDDILTYLQNPDRNEKNLRNMSRFLYDNSAHYRRLISYFADMPLFYYTVEPLGLDTSKVNLKTFKLAYSRACNTIENMNIYHEFNKILKIAFKEDIFYGYEYGNDKSYTIQRLNPDYCQVSSIEDGVYNFAFDFSYFDSHSDELYMYDKEFQLKYNIYKNGKTDYKWQELDSEKTICIKINQDIDYPYPPFASIFLELYDIQDYKALKKAKEELGNYKLLVMKIPMRKDSDNLNDFTIELDKAVDFYQKGVQALPDQVGMILSPMDIDSINFDKDTIDKNRVDEAEKSFWNGAGVSKNLFSGDANSGAGITLSMQTDMEMVLSIIRQFERWLNRKLKFMSGTYSFKVDMLNVTVFNQSDVTKQYLELAQYGIPVKRKVCASVGMQPNDVNTSIWLENKVLKLQDKLIPLQSSHTQSGNSSSGTPKTAGTNTEGSTEQTEENDGNNPDNRT